MTLELEKKFPIQSVTAPSIDPSKDVLGMNVLNLSWDCALKHAIRQLDETTKPQVFAFLNAHNANVAVTDPVYRQALNQAHILPDGFGVDLAGLVHGGEMFQANLNGTDFIPSFFIYADQPLNVAMVGGRRKVAEQAADRFRQATPWHSFTVISDGYFEMEKTPHILKKLEKMSPDILLVAMGTPLQEKWVHDHIRAEHAKLVFTVGALFDFMSDQVPRAPISWRKMRVEWAFRLLREPKRLWRRYLIGNPLFLTRVALRKLRGRNKREMG